MRYVDMGIRRIPDRSEVPVRRVDVAQVPERPRVSDHKCVNCRCPLHPECEMWYSRRNDDHGCKVPTCMFAIGMRQLNEEINASRWRTTGFRDLKE